MKSKILILFLSLFSLALIGQDGLVSGNLNVTVLPSSNGDGTFNVSGTFSDPKGQYFATDVDTGMVFWKGNNFYLIDSIITASGANLTVRVQDTYSTGFIPTGNAQIVELTPNLGLPGVSTAGDSNAALTTPPDHAAILNYLIQRIDSELGGAGPDKSIYAGSDSLTQEVTVVDMDKDNQSIAIGDFEDFVDFGGPYGDNDIGLYVDYIGDGSVGMANNKNGNLNYIYLYDNSFGAYQSAGSMSASIDGSANIAADFVRQGLTTSSSVSNLLRRTTAYTGIDSFGLQFFTGDNIILDNLSTRFFQGVVWADASVLPANYSGFVMPFTGGGFTAPSIPSWRVSKTTFYEISIEIDNNDTNHSISLYNDKYRLPNAQPSITNATKSIMTWTGDGSSTVPAMEEWTDISLMSELPQDDVDIDANENSFSIDTLQSLSFTARRAAGTAVSRFTLGSNTTLPITFSNENPADANDRARLFLDWDGVSGIGLGATGTRLDFSTESQPVLLGPGGNAFTFWPDSAHFSKRLIIEEGGGPELTLRRSTSPEILFDGFSDYRMRGGVSAWQFQNAATNQTIFQIDADAPLSIVIEDDSTLVFSQYSSTRPYDLFSVRGLGEPYFDGTGRVRKKPMGSGNYDAPNAGSLTNDYEYVELGFAGTYTLPDPTTNKGKVFTLIADSATDAGGNARSVDVAGGGLIEGNATLTLDNAYEVYQLVSSGSEYIILSNKP